MEERGGNLALSINNQFEDLDRPVVSCPEIKTLETIGKLWRAKLQGGVFTLKNCECSR